MPARGARIPIRNGLFCAIAGANTPPDTDTAPTAAADASSLRREIAMPSSLVCQSVLVILDDDISLACHQQAMLRRLMLTPPPCRLETRRFVFRSTSSRCRD